MRRFSLITWVFAGLLSGLSALADCEGKDVVALTPVLTTGKAFSFRQGKVIQARNEPDDFFSDVDLVWDPSTGLAANNSKLLPPFAGQGAIVSLGKKTLDEVIQLNFSKAEWAIDAKELTVGHCYGILMANGQDRGTIRLVAYEPNKNVLKFCWKRYEVPKK